MSPIMFGLRTGGPEYTSRMPHVWRRIAGLGVLLIAVSLAQPCFAQKLYPYEPPIMDPYSTIYVNDGSCSAGKVLKVQGSPRNQRRKKSCVPMNDLHSIPRSATAR